jgi:16S rRNA G966 N2-methylase RsmD
MFERLRRRLVAAMERSLDLPPPSGADAGLREAIAAFHRDAPERYAEFFLRGRSLSATAAEAPLFERLVRAGLAAKLGPALHAPCVRLFHIEGRFIATDLLSRARPDQVFSLMFEQVYLGRNTGARAGDEVLELCLGSGVNAIAAAAKGARVTGVELGPRAAAFARFNRALAGAEVEILEGSLFAPVAGRRFDLVLVNPPFELVPPGEEWFLHSHGGEDGLAVVREILSGLPAHLNPGGRFEIITWSPATKDGPVLVDLLRAALPAYHLSVHLLDEGPLEAHVEGFAKSPGYAAWRRALADRGIDRVQFLFVRAAAGEPGVGLSRPEGEIAACHGLADAWES